LAGIEQLTVKGGKIGSKKKNHHERSKNAYSKKRRWMCV